MGAALLLGACTSEEDRYVASLPEAERASYLAIERFQNCMKPVIARAKRRPDLTSQQIDRLGYECPVELKDVAVKLAARAEYRAEEPEFRGLPHDRKAALITEEFAGIAVCKLRDCGTID
jgi:hypothetical protein